MFDNEKKGSNFISSLKFGVEMNVWSQAIGLHTKISITNLVMGCKGHVK
jgi:hypothetical protein